MQKKIQTWEILYGPALSSQVIGILGWLANVLMNPFNTSNDLRVGLAGTALMSALVLTPLKYKNIYISRACVIAFIILTALLIRWQIFVVGEIAYAWIFPLSILVVLVSTIFYTFLIDYIVTALATWLIFFYGNIGIVVNDALLGIFAIVILITSAFGVLINITYIKTVRHLLEAKDKYKYEAETDQLTGIHNRRYFMSALSRICSQAYDSHYYCIMLDLDNFKKINDLNGHDTGDLVIIDFAQLIKRHFPDALSARIGGEEFCVFARRQNHDELREQLQALLDSVRMSHVGGIRYSFSAGVSLMKDGDTPSTLMKSADQSLYQAKCGGRSRVFYQEKTICD